MLAQAERSLLDPWFLALVPLAVFFFVWRMRRRRAALPAGDVTLLHSLPKTLRSRLVQLPTVLKLLAVASLALAMARPVSRDRLPLRELGVDIMIVLDTSTSMDIADMVADRRRRRMDAARGQALTFVAARTNDRVGLMTYAQYPELRCPLTLDQNALEEFLLDVDIVTDRREDGTVAQWEGVLLGPWKLLQQTPGGLTRTPARLNGDAACTSIGSGSTCIRCSARSMGPHVKNVSPAAQYPTHRWRRWRS